MKKLFFILIIALAFSTPVSFAENGDPNCVGDTCNINYNPNSDTGISSGGATVGTSGSAGAAQSSGGNPSTATSGSGTATAGSTDSTSSGTYGSGGIPTGSAGTNSCDYISSQSDYNRCCVNNPNPSYSCAIYSIQAAQSQYCKDHPQDATCAGVSGQVGGGTQGTNAINGAVATQTTTAGAPQSGSADLTKCSAIKFKSILDILIWVKCIITAAIIPLIFIFAFLFFLFSVLKFMMANEKAKKDDARKMIFASLVGLFVMVAVWGIIKIVSSTLGIESTGIPFLQTQYLDPNKSSK